MMGFTFLTVEFIMDLLAQVSVIFLFLALVFCYGCTMAAIDYAFESKEERAWKLHKKKLKQDFIKKYI